MIIDNIIPYKIESIEQILDVLKTGTKYSDTVLGGTVILFLRIKYQFIYLMTDL